MKKQGHYCKICDQYKSNESFSGNGHTNHICKSCGKLSGSEQAESIAVNKLYNLPYRLSKEQIKWLKNRTTDSRPDVSEIAKEIYNQRFPYAERNARKKQTHISDLVFYVCTDMFDEYDFEFIVSEDITFHLNRMAKYRVHRQR